MNKTSQEPLVSVLLSIYKVEEYLEECLDSILNQSYKNLEIVCVDNGSPDRCGQILQEYARKDKRIKVITLQENRMLGGGRNAGLDNAMGEFVCFVDPDDWIEKNHIKAMVDSILTHRDPEGKPYHLVVNSAAYNYLHSDKSILSNYNKPEGNVSIDDYNHDVHLDTDIPMWGRLYRKSVLDFLKIRFLEGVNLDNISFTIKIFAYIKNFYRINDDTNSQTTYWRRMLTPEGAITAVVLWKNMEVPLALDNLYDYLKKHQLGHKVKVPFYLFFNICFPIHRDQTRYYISFKELMKKMENDIKHPQTVYSVQEHHLCDLLLYSSDFFTFCKLFFAKDVNVKKCSVKLFGIIPFWTQKRLPSKTYYKLFGIPCGKTLIDDTKKTVYLFHFLPLFSVSLEK